jgi:hypothetical protein
MGESRDHLVVVGGWVPALRLADGPEPYVGTLDVDLTEQKREASHES